MRAEAKEEAGSLREWKKKAKARGEPEMGFLRR